MSDSISIEEQQAIIIQELMRENSDLLEKVRKLELERNNFDTEPPYYTREDFRSFKAIKHGGFGLISIGRLDDLGQIAVKEFLVTKEQRPELWKREIEILIKRRHPNIVPLYGILWNGFDKAKYLGYVMEYVEGGSLHDLIYDSAQHYDMLQIYPWIEQIARGLQFLHKYGIIHRDIKPDKGGTNYYMSPEMISKGKSTPKADIYSLAITIWELCHRKEPYHDCEESNGLNHLLSIINGARPTVDTDKCDQEMTALIQRCWEEDPCSRPTARAIADEIGEKVDSLLGQQAAAKTIMIIGGGKDTGKEHGGIAFLSADRSKWIEPILPLPLHAWCSGAVYLDGEIYLFGGAPSLKAVYKLAKNMKWNRLADMNVGRQWISNSAVALDGYIWVFGGEDEKFKRLKSVERYDPKQNTWTVMRDMKYPRSKAAASVLNGNILISGGWINKSEATDTVECYNPEDNTWTDYPEMPAILGGHCLVPHGNKFIIMGGYFEEEGPCDFVWEVEFHQTEITGNELPPMKNSGMWFGGAALDKEIYAIGGCHRIGSDMERVEIFDGEKWRDGPPLAINRFNMSTMVVPQSFANRLCL